MSRGYIIPMLLICVGLFWLASSLDIFPSNFSVFACLLIISGGVILILDGLHKTSLWQSGLLAYSGFACLAWEHFNISSSVLLAVGFIVWGCLLIMAKSSRIPYKYASKNSTSHQ